MPKRDDEATLVLPETPQTIQAPTPTPIAAQTVDKAKYDLLLDRLQVLEAQIASQTTAQALNWWGACKAAAKGVMTKGFNGQAGKPSERGFIRFFSAKGIHPDTMKGLPATPAATITLAFLYLAAARFLVKNAEHFDFSGPVNKETGQKDQTVIEHWSEVVATFGTK